MLGRLLGVVLAWTLMASAAAAAETDAAALQALRQKIVSGELPGVHSVIVVRGGKTLAEWYFPGKDERRGLPLGEVAFTADTLHDVRSVSKSVVSILLGIALKDGAIESLDTPVLDYFPEYPELKTPERMKITLRHIFSMTSGLKWDETSVPYIDARNSEIAMDLAPDRYRYVLEQDVVTPPGSQFRYSGGDVALAGAVLARATKTPLEDYARAKLFAPLGITPFQWDKDPKGVPFAASGLRLRPRDMATIGQLMLQGGRWKGRQIVPKAWVTASTSRQAQVAPDPKCGTRYGYYWWLNPGCPFTPPTPVITANGNGGQRIWVIPSRDLVVVTTMGGYNRPTPAADAILAAVLKAAKP